MINNTKAMAHIISYKQLPRLRFSTAARESLAYGLSLLFIILFLYTVYHKALKVDAFVNGISQIPYLATYSVGIAWGVLIAEAVVALLLIWPDTNRLALWGALGLMVVFTVYIGAMLLLAEQLPCHCGGAIEKLTWGQHLLFNCGFIALAAGLLLYHYKVNVKYKILTAMKAINSKIKKAAFGVMAAALSIGFSAFTVQIEQEWVFMGNDELEALDGDMYQQAVAPPTACESGEELPCILKTPEEIDDQNKLDTYLSTTFGNDPEAVIEAAESRREPEQS